MLILLSVFWLAMVVYWVCHHRQYTQRRAALSVSDARNIDRYYELGESLRGLKFVMVTVLVLSGCGVAILGAACLQYTYDRDNLVYRRLLEQAKNKSFEQAER